MKKCAFARNHVVQTVQVFERGVVFDSQCRRVGGQPLQTVVVDESRVVVDVQIAAADVIDVLQTDEIGQFRGASDLQTAERSELGQAVEVVDVCACDF